MLGGCRDAGGEAEWTNEADPSDSVQRGSPTGSSGQAREWTAPVTHRWAGIVGYTASGLPIVRAAGKGLFVAGGYNGTGNVVRPTRRGALSDSLSTAVASFAALIDGAGI